MRGAATSYHPGGLGRAAGSSAASSPGRRTPPQDPVIRRGFLRGSTPPSRWVVDNPTLHKQRVGCLAPSPGIEPGAGGLTIRCSAAELAGNVPDCSWVRSRAGVTTNRGSPTAQCNGCTTAWMSLGARILRYPGPTPGSLCCPGGRLPLPATRAISKLHYGRESSASPLRRLRRKPGLGPCGGRGSGG